MATITNAATARTLLENAVAANEEPILATTDIDLLLELAASTDAATQGTVYESAALDRSAATGWVWKAGRTIGEVDLGGGAGVSLKSSQLHDHCMSMAQHYASGRYSVVGVVSRSGAMGSIGMTSATRASSDVWYPEG